MKKKYPIMLVLLVCLDQVIKMIIHYFFMDVRVVYADIIGFQPFLNTTQMSIFNNELALQIQFDFLIILNLIAIALIPLLIFWLKKKNIMNIKLYNVFLFLSAGAVSSLVDKVFWGGSLDYFRIFSQITDLKDIYLVAGLIYYVIGAISEIKESKSKR